MLMCHILILAGHSKKLTIFTCSKHEQAGEIRWKNSNRELANLEHYSLVRRNKQEKPDRKIVTKK